MKNLLKYTVFALIVGTITVIFQLDGMTKTVISKGLFIAFSVADKCLADNNGGPSLVAVGTGTQNATTYSVANSVSGSNGLSLSNGLTNPGNYAIEATFSLNTLVGFNFNRLIDFKGGAAATIAVHGAGQQAPTGASVHPPLVLSTRVNANPDGQSFSGQGVVKLACSIS